MAEAAVESAVIEIDEKIREDFRETFGDTGRSPITDATASPTADDDADGAWSRQARLSHAIYWGIHAACLLAFFTGVSVTDIVVCLGLFWARMFGITGGYHRYFSHKTYRTSRVFQFCLALLGTLAVQKGPLWWAAGHRRHHRYSDREGDMHSPRHSFWYSHQGWIFDDRWGATELDRIKDFAKYPELMWLNRWHVVPPIVLSVLLWWAFGFSTLLWGMGIGTTLLWHSTYTINSLAHRFGKQRFETGDDSRNNVWLALLTLGEGWHNNHHHYQASTRQGFYWWEVDVTYYVLRLFARLGLVWDLREPPQSVLEAGARAR